MLSDWFSNVNPPSLIFDPKVVYDHYADRWIILALGYSGGDNPASSYLISVSHSSDPTAGWYNFNLDASLNGNQNSNTWADYPGLGYDQRAIYITSNQFLFGGGFQYAKIRILNKSQLYNNQTPTWTDFWNMKDANGAMSTSIKPAHHFSTPSSGYLVNTHWNGSNYITLWRIDNPITNPSLTRQTSVTVASYSIPPDAKQPNSDDDIDTGDCRTQDAVYRDGYIYTAFTTGYNWGNGTVSAIRYVKIDVASNNAELDAVYGADGVYYYYPAIYVDGNGNMAMVFNRSSTSEYAGVYWTFRSLADSSAHPSEILKAGEGIYVRYDNSGRNRWGDYSGIALDPTDLYKIWFYGEWARNNNTWGTWVGSFEFIIPVTFTNKIGDENAGGTLLVNDQMLVNSGGNIELEQGSQNTVKTLNERFINWQNGAIDYKHHDWNEMDPEYLLNHDFIVTPGPNQFQDANFISMHPVEIKNYSISANGAGDGNVEFHDPWYVDADGNQPDDFLSFGSPYHPTGAAGETEGGVFLNQSPDPNNPDKPYYSVRAPQQQVIPFHGEDITWYFQGWAGERVSFQSPEQNETAVVFLQDSAEARALYKGHLASSVSDVSGSNNQR